MALLRKEVSQAIHDNKNDGGGGIYMILEKGTQILTIFACHTQPWAFLVAQLTQKPPAMRETWVRSLEKGMPTHSSILAWIMPWTV